MIWAGTQRTKKAKRFRKYLALIGRRESISITTLAQAMPGVGAPRPVTISRICWTAVF